MASQHSNGSSSKSKKYDSPHPPLYCYHDVVAPLRTVKHNGPNQRKRFFKWVDEVDDISHLQAQILDKNLSIIELEEKVEQLKEKVKKLKDKKEKLAEEVGMMGITATESLIEMKENISDKKLMLTLIFSCMFFIVVLFIR
uniref:Uncharacterized protein n=1 Tax=Chenopodium quinoa TaxID=63459 RepID=A0A803NBJ9_CHEQI